MEQRKKFNGRVWIWEIQKKLICFQTGDQNKKKAFVMIGGLTDGILSLPYSEIIIETLSPMGWTIFQPQLSSSWLGWGMSTLKQDADEISQFVQVLTAEGFSTCVLCGSSTGCQDIVQTLKKKEMQQVISGIVLQGPVRFGYYKI
jgi:hypothetical protein